MFTINLPISSMADGDAGMLDVVQATVMKRKLAGERKNVFHSLMLTGISTRPLPGGDPSQHSNLIRSKEKMRDYLKICLLIDVYY